MKIVNLVGLLCLVGLSLAFPAEELSERRPLRRNGGASIQAIRARQQQDEQRGGNRPEKRKRPVSSSSDLPYAAPLQQERREVPARVQSTRPSVQDDNFEASQRDIATASSDAYGSGAYDESQLKFEQGVQNYAASYDSDKGVKDGRLNFAISGQQGPHSYRFGYDTGKGADRVFRFEERDSYGVVYGRYGYYDPSGKFRIVNYKAHPEHGFSADANFGPK